MAISKGRQLSLLAWKNFKLQLRKPVFTLACYILPIIVCGILLFLRSSFPVEEQASHSARRRQTKSPDSWMNILYAPQTTQVKKIMREFETFCPINAAKACGRGFPTEEDMVKEFNLVQNNSEDNLFGGVVFVNTDINNFTYRLRPKQAQEPWFTRDKFLPPSRRFGQKPSPVSYIAYDEGDFLDMQFYLTASVIKAYKHTYERPFLEYQQIPIPGYFKDSMLSGMAGVVSVLFLLAFMLIVMVIVKNIVIERERRLKEAMILMGIESSMYWTSWSIQYIVYFLISMGLATVALSVKVVGGVACWRYADPFVVFVFLFTYGISLMCFLFMVSVFLKKENTASFVALVVFILVTVPWWAYVEKNYATLDKPIKIVCFFSTNIAFLAGFHTIASLDMMEVGARWATLTTPIDDVTLLDIILMMGADSVLYLLILSYVGNVWPGEFGVPQPWYFPFSMRYWFGNKSIKPETMEKVDEPNKACFEKPPATLTAGVVISHLRRKFGSKVAVADMSLTMYYDQITALLGHNGAGKTTALSMLTGFLPPTSGTAVVNGYDIKRDIKKVRDGLGLCPQHDILFDDLTVREHMLFYCQIKGKRKHEAMTEADDMIELVGLGGKKNARSKTLSGGQKRKLSVAIALCGGSKVIVLDEPSSGMDPSARRDLWDILIKMKSGRAIILSTHFMDEADVLGDRIAILGGGVVKCCGSSLFLKNLYGTGYHLTIAKATGFRGKDTKSLICHHVPNAEVFQEAGVDIIYMLPRAHRNKFEGLFRDLEKSKYDLNIGNFGVNETTMDDVFFKVGEDIDVEPVDASSVHDPPSHHRSSVTNRRSSFGESQSVRRDSHTAIRISQTAIRDSQTTLRDSQRGKQDSLQKRSSQHGHDVNNSGTTGNLIKFNENLVKNKGPKLMLQKFYALIVKKVIHAKRNLIMTFCQIAIPIVLTVFVLVLLTKSGKVAEDKADIALSLDLNGYSESIVPFTAESSSPYMNKFLANYKSLVTKTKAKFEKVDNLTIYYEQQMDDKTVHEFKNNMLIGVSITTTDKVDILDLRRSKTKRLIVAHWSKEGYHLIGISVSYALNAWLKTELNSSCNIHAINHPLGLSKMQQDKKAEEDRQNFDMFSGFPISAIMLAAMVITLSLFVIFLIKERQSHSKHVQMSSGVSSLMYWFSHFCCDLLICLVISALITMLFAIFDLESFSGGTKLGVVFLVLMAFSFAYLPFVYVSSFMFSSGGGAVGFLLTYGFFTGFITGVVQVVFAIQSLGMRSVTGEILEYIFIVISSPFCIFTTFFNMYLIYRVKSIKSFCDSVKCLKDEGSQHICCTGYLSMKSPGVGKHILALFGQSCVLMLLTILFEYGVIRKVCIKLFGKYTVTQSSGLEDSDVINERERVHHKKSALMKENTLVVDKITKVFGNLLAVDRLCLAVPTYQCFGLLGVNGAGKTTAFKMLTGELVMTQGDAFINGMSVRTNIRDARKDIGYCPQYDALIDQMTGRETLFMFSRFRGITPSIIPRVVDEVMASLWLTEHANKPCSTYSGGTKRKLSTAISLIGDPSIIFLDEPTTGIDPAARRQVWNVLSQVRSTGRTLVFTSHSMEECDALCDRIAIMVNGVFRCLGSSQHLKSKFGEGYILTVKIASPSETEVPDLIPFMKKIEHDFPQHRQLSVIMNYATYQLTDPTLSLADIFGNLEKARGPFNIEDYSVTQTTLDQIFINFAKTQRDAMKTDVGCCKRCCLTCMD